MHVRTCISYCSVGAGEHLGPRDWVLPIGVRLSVTCRPNVEKNSFIVSLVRPRDRHGGGSSGVCATRYSHRNTFHVELSFAAIANVSNNSSQKENGIRTGSTLSEERGAQSA